MRHIPVLLIPGLLLAASGAAAQSATTDALIQRAALLRAQWQARAAAGEVSASPTEPAITGGKILTASVDVTKQPGVPEVQLTIDTGTAGVVGGQATLVSPDGKHMAFAGLTIPGYPPAPTHYIFNTLLQSQFSTGTLGLYAQPGSWSIAGVLLVTGDGQFVSYGTSQLAALFHAPAAFTVINPNPVDTRAPDVGAGTITTPTISLSAAHPFAVIRLPVSDNLSGVANATIGLSGPNSISAYTSASIGAPLKMGVLDTYYLLPSTTPTGTYTITLVSVCDAAGNCSTLNTPSGIAAHFKATTITVTD